MGAIAQRYIEQPVQYTGFWGQGSLGSRSSRPEPSVLRRCERPSSPCQPSAIGKRETGELSCCSWTSWISLVSSRGIISRFRFPPDRPPQRAARQKQWLQFPELYKRH